MESLMRFTQAPTHSSSASTASTWKFFFNDSEKMTTTTTTTTITAPTERTPMSTLLEVLNSSMSTIKVGSNNLTVPSAGEDVAVDIGGGDGVQTPLNAPQPSLEPVTQPPLSGHTPELSELGWIIPITIVCLAVTVVLAFAFYCGMRKLELRMLGWCYRNCGCCCAPGGGQGGRLLRGEQYDTLSEESGRKETVRLRDFQEDSQSYGVTRNVPKEGSPRRELGTLEDDGHT